MQLYGMLKTVPLLLLLRLIRYLTDSTGSKLAIAQSDLTSAQVKRHLGTRGWNEGDTKVEATFYDSQDVVDAAASVGVVRCRIKCYY